MSPLKAPEDFFQRSRKNCRTMDDLTLAHLDNLDFQQKLKDGESEGLFASYVTVSPKPNLLSLVNVDQPVQRWIYRAPSTRRPPGTGWYPSGRPRLAEGGVFIRPADTAHDFGLTMVCG